MSHIGLISHKPRTSIGHPETKVWLILFITLALVLSPFLLGLFNVLSSSIGISPLISNNTTDVSFRILQNPLVWKQLLFSIIRANSIGLIVLLASFFIGFLLSSKNNSGHFHKILFFLSIPHVSLAIGFGFLIMPTGFILRIIATILQKDEVLQITTINDPWGIAMSLVVSMKLIAFMSFMIVLFSKDYHVEYHSLQSKLLQHNKIKTWTFVVFPTILPKLFTPFIISLSYALAPIEISTILGPRSPSSFSLMIKELLGQIEDKYFIDANVLCIILILATLFCVLLWYGIFHGIRAILRHFYVNHNHSKLTDNIATRISTTTLYTLVVIMILSSVLLLIWSFTLRWQYPHIFPDKVGVSHVIRYFNDATNALFNTFLLGLTVNIFSLCISLVVLECLYFLKWKLQLFVLGLLFLPLVLPGIAYISGMRIFFLILGIDGSFFALTWAQSLRVIPYMILILYGPYKAFNSFYIIQSLLLGKSYMMSFLRIKIPMLISIISYTVIVGFTVSIAEYVTTFYISQGRWGTITTLSVALSSGAERNVMGLSALFLGIINILVLSLGIYLEKMQKGVKKINL